MDLKNLATVLLLTAAVAGLSITTASFGSTSGLDVNLEFPARQGAPVAEVTGRENLSHDSPGSMAVYRYMPSIHSADDALTLASTLSMDAPEMEYDLSMDAYVMQSDHRSLVVSRNVEKVSYHDSGADAESRSLIAAGQEPNLPGPEQAHGQALATLRSLNLLPGEEQVAADSPIFTWNEGGFVTLGQTANGTAEGHSAETAIQVRFPRLVDAHPTIGPGAKLFVQLGHEGELSRIVKVWPSLSEAGDAEVLDLHTALAFTKPSERTAYRPGGCAAASLQHVYLAYYLPDVDSDQDHAFPVYVLEGPCFDETGGTMVGPYETYRELVPAISG